MPALLARVSFSGELGYEIYCASQYQLRLFEGIEEAGVDLGLKFYGNRTLMSLRLEKNWGVWTLDFRPDFTAAQSGLDAFIQWDKDFIGKEAALAERKGRLRDGVEADQQRIKAITNDARKTHQHAEKGSDQHRDRQSRDRSPEGLSSHDKKQAPVFYIGQR